MHDGCVERLAGPQAGVHQGLVNEHAQTGERCAACGLRRGEPARHGRIGNYIRNDHARNKCVRVYVQGLVGVRVEADRGGIDHDVRALGDREVRCPRLKARTCGRMGIHEGCEFLAAFDGSVHDGHAAGAGQCRFDRDGPRGPTSSEDDELLAGRVSDRPQGLHETLTVGVLTREVTVLVDHRVDRADDPRAGCEFVQVLDDRLLVGNGAVEAEPPHADGAAHRIGEPGRGNLTVDVADI